jgi:hypothetical protein
MTKDNPMSVDSLVELKESLKDFYDIRGYIPRELYIDQESYGKITGYPIGWHREDYDIWTNNGSVSIKRASSSNSQMSFNYGGYGKYENDYSPKKKCCDKPTIIMNEAMGKKFYVCRSCKKETDKDGFEIKS